MILKAQMIYLHFNKNDDNIDEDKIVKKISVLDDKYYKKDTILGGDNTERWYTYTHYRSEIYNDPNKRFYQLGFELKGDVTESSVYKLSLSSDGVEFIDLKYDSKTGIYYDLGKYKIINKKLNFPKNLEDMPVGVVNSGMFHVYIRNNANKIIEKSPEIYVLPSSMSPNDYEEMLDDLLNIRNDLLIYQNSKVGFTGSWEYRRSSVEDCLMKIKGPINRINQNPKVNLSTVVEKKSVRPSQKLKGRTLVEKELMPYKNKYHVQNVKETVDTYENQMIKYALTRLKKEVINYGENYLKETEKKEAETYFIKKNIEKKYTSNLKVEDRINEIESEIQKEKNKIEKILKKEKERNELKPNIDDIYIAFEIYVEHNLSELRREVSIRNNGMSIKLNANKKNVLQLRRQPYFYYEANDKNKKEAVFFGNPCTIIMDNNRLSEIAFFKDELYTNKGKSIRIKALAKRNSAEFDDPLGGIVLDKYSSGNRIVKTYNIELVEIYSINNKKTPSYHVDKIKEIMESDINKNIEEKFGEIEEEKKFLQSVIKQNEINEIEKKRFLNQNKNWQYIIKQLDSYLNSDLFEEVNDVYSKWEPTQTFIRDYNYNLIYKNLKKLDSKIKFISEFDSKSFTTQTTERIYEKWVFFKMVQILTNDQRWDLKNHDELLRWMESKKRGKDLKAVLSRELHKGKKITLTIHDNKEIGKLKLRPDYTLIFKEEDVKKEDVKKIIYLDAKYRNYRDQGGKHVWLEDIKNTSIDKYIKRITKESMENQPISSFIIHPDTGVDYTAFGGYFSAQERKSLGWRGVSQHKFGSFSFVPSHTLNFRTFIRMLLEYHLGLYDCCWNCGESNYLDDKIKRETKKTAGGYEKFHYTCKTCGDFWVRTHCEIGGKNHMLIKHSFNYHQLKDDSPWFVICPKCK